MQRLRGVDWARVKRNGINIFAKLIRTKDPSEGENAEELPGSGRQRLSRCLTTTDLTSLGVGSCVGTGMYLVAGMVARNFAGPGVIFSFIIAAIASIFSGACYAEFGVRVPNTTGSAYMYSYVTVGEFIAFIIGWNMVLEYMIGTSACARALSACFDTISSGAVTRYLVATFGTIYGKPPDFLACGITLLMMLVLIAGVKKSIFFNNILNFLNFTAWVYIMVAGLFYADTSNWTNHHDFLPYGWSGVFSGAATCFYAFIGFDIIATTGEEAHNPKRSIPLAIISSLAVILIAYVTSSMMLTLIVPYDQVDIECALVEMFGHVNAPISKSIAAVGALAGLTVSMFGSMFPMPRVIYAMAQDGLIFKGFSKIWERTGTPALSTVGGGLAAAGIALLVKLEVLVEMMSIGTLLAYTLVSAIVLVLRYQPHMMNLIELLPHRLRNPVSPDFAGEASFSGFQGEISGTQITAPNQQRVMVRRVTRSSPDSDDSLQGDESEDYGRDDAFLVGDRSENKFYGTVPGGCHNGAGTAFGRFLNAILYKLQTTSFGFPVLYPWVEMGPATYYSGMYVTKASGVMFVLIIIFDMFAAYGYPGTGGVTNFFMVVLFIGILTILLMISRRPQNRNALMYTTPGLPYVPTIAITVNVYLILNLSILTLVRFTVWMSIGLVVYFKYGINNSLLEMSRPVAPPTPIPRPTVLDRTTLPPPTAPARRPGHDRNIFEGDGGDGSGGPYGSDNYGNPLLAWHETDLSAPNTTHSGLPTFVEQRYNHRTNTTTTHTAIRPPWAYPDTPGFTTPWD